MVCSGQPIESNLHRHLIEHLNAEVVLRTITDLEVAMQWLASTFLYVRARKNPRPYGINTDLSKDQIDKKLLEICKIDLNKLVKAGMITMDEDINITATTTGHIMAKYYVAFETMKLFTQVSGTEIMIQILDLISRCHEFSEVRLRVNDKKTLNFLNKNAKNNTIRYPLTGKIKTWNMKVNCLIQAVLGNLDITDHSILSETFIIMRNASRVIKCLIEYLETRKANCYNALLNAVILSKCLQAKLWENTPYVSKQLTGIGSVMSHQLVNARKTSFKEILNSNPRDIEVFIKRKPPMGNTLIDEVKHLPIYKMELEKINNGAQLKLSIELTNVEDLREKSTVRSNSSMTLIVGNNLNKILIYETYKHSYMMEKGRLQKFLDVNYDSTEIHAHFISNNWVGFDCNSTVTLHTVENTKKKTTAKTEEKNRPTYIQMFLDQYMKIKKKKETVKGDKNTKKTSNNEKEELEAVEADNTDKAVIEKTPRKAKKNKQKLLDQNDEKLQNNSKKKKTKGSKTVDEDSTKEKTVNDIGKDSNQENEKPESYQELSEEVPKNGEVGKTSNMEVHVGDVIKNVDVEEEENLNTSAVSLFSDGLDNTLAEYVDKMDDENINGSHVGEVKANEEEFSLNRLEEQPKSAEKSIENGENVKESNKKPILDFGRLSASNPNIFRIYQKYITDEQVVQNDSDIKTRSKNKQGKKNDGQLGFKFYTQQSHKNEEAKKRQTFDEFKLPSKRKLTHYDDIEDLPDSTQEVKRYAITETLEPGKPFGQNAGAKSKDERSAENAQKSITWRSPLVFSPAVKFSPKLNFPIDSFKGSLEAEQHENNANETLETSASSRSTNNLTVNLQRTFKQNRNMNKPKGNRGTEFPLCDTEHEVEENSDENKDLSREDPYDICSTSFLEKMGIQKNRFKANLQQPLHSQSPTANYYSQFIYEPLYSKKEGQKLKEGLSASQMGRGMENLTQKSPIKKNEANKENNVRPTSQINYPNNERTENYPKLPSEFILSQNKPLACTTRPLNRVASNEFSDSRLNGNTNSARSLNASMQENYVPSPDLYRHSLQNLQPNYGPNPNFYRSAQHNLHPGCLNDTITSQNFQNRYCFQQCCHRNPYRNPYVAPRPICRGSFDCMPPRDLNRSRLDESFSVNQLNAPLHPYDYPPRQSFEPPVHPQHSFHRDGVLHKYPYAHNNNAAANVINQSFAAHPRHFEDTEPEPNLNTSLYKPDFQQTQNGNYRTSNNPGWSTGGTAEKKATEGTQVMPNRSQMFEEKPILNDDRANMMHRDDQLDVLNNSFMGRSGNFPQEWDVRPGSYNYAPQASGCYGMAPIGWPYQQGFYPKNGREFDVFPSNNDKEYVMNKFLYSLSQE